MSEDTVMLALAELAKQVRELADRVSRLEHARAEDAQRIDAHEQLHRARLPQDEEFATIRAELARRGQAAP